MGMKSKILGEIVMGNADDYLKDIYEAVREREKQKKSVEAYMNMSSVEEGDKVVLKGLSPKYLNGIEVEVCGKKGKKVMVKFGRAIGKFPADVPIGIPASCVKLV